LSELAGVPAPKPPTGGFFVPLGQQEKKFIKKYIFT